MKLTAKEAAAHYGVDICTIRRWAKCWIERPGTAPRGVEVQQPGGKRGRITILLAKIPAPVAGGGSSNWMD